MAEWQPIETVTTIVFAISAAGFLASAAVAGDALGQADFAKEPERRTAGSKRFGMALLFGALSLAVAVISAAILFAP